MSVMNPKVFVDVRALLVAALLSTVAAGSHAQPSGPGPEASSGGQQLPTIEGKWVLQYDYPAGIHKTRVFTIERDKSGKLIGTQDEPVCPCDLIISFKGDKLRMKLTPHKPTRIVSPNPLPPGTILGDPISTIFEAKVTGDTMRGKFYGENVPGSSINFTGVRKTAVDAASPVTKQ
jgi:hypothetical protein